jgi:hypothetical protein
MGADRADENERLRERRGHGAEAYRHHAKPWKQRESDERERGPAHRSASQDSAYVPERGKVTRRDDGDWAADHQPETRPRQGIRRRAPRRAEDDGNESGTRAGEGSQHGPVDRGDETGSPLEDRAGVLPGSEESGHGRITDTPEGLEEHVGGRQQLRGETPDAQDRDASDRGCADVEALVTEQGDDADTLEAHAESQHPTDALP